MIADIIHHHLRCFPVLDNRQAGHRPFDEITKQALLGLTITMIVMDMEEVNTRTNMTMDTKAAEAIAITMIHITMRILEVDMAEVVEESM